MGCVHQKEIKEDFLHIRHRPKGCEECLKIGQGWVHLRECLVCGHVGCCDSSIGKHATGHFHALHHPVMRSLEPGDHWGWCYVDQLMFEIQ